MVFLRNDLALSCDYEFGLIIVLRMSGVGGAGGSGGGDGKKKHSLGECIIYTIFFLKKNMTAPAPVISLLYRLKGCYYTPAFGFFVPYFERDVAREPTPP